MVLKELQKKNLGLRGPDSQKSGFNLSLLKKTEAMKILEFSAM
jgi:hypothetical protein